MGGCAERLETNQMTVVIMSDARRVGPLGTLTKWSEPACHLERLRLPLLVARASAISDEHADGRPCSLLNLAAGSGDETLQSVTSLPQRLDGGWSSTFCVLVLRSGCFVAP